MKSTGIVRNIDRLGRVVLPMELRKLLDLKVQDPVEIFTQGSDVVIRKYRPSCVFCNRDDEIVEFKGLNVCTHCIEELSAPEEALTENEIL